DDPHASDRDGRGRGARRALALLARRRLGHGEGRRGRRRDGVDELAVRLSGGPTSSTTAQTNVVGPSQSPHASITLRAVPPATAQESFDSVTIRSAPRRTAASANPGSTAS